MQTTAFYKVAFVAIAASLVGLIFLAADGDDSLTGMNTNFHVASFSIFLTLMMEFNLDKFINYMTGSLNKLFLDSNGYPIEHPFGHGLIITSLLPTSLILFFPGTWFAAQNIQIFLIAGEALAVCGVLGKILTFSPGMWTAYNALLVLLLFLANQLIPFVIANLTFGFEFYAHTGIITSSTCLLILVVLVWNSMPCFRELVLLSNNAMDIFIRREFLSVVLSANTCMYISALVCFSFLPLDVKQLIQCRVLAQLLYVISTAVLPGRILRRGLLALKREIELKKTFVRYISHEVRSPLSTMFMGLQCLQSSITELSQYAVDLKVQEAAKESEPNETDSLNHPSDDQEKDSSTASSITLLDSIVEELTSTTEDCQQACELAIHTLDDLLLYDKIECKMVTIETKLMSIYDVVYCTVKPFHMIASAKEVTLDLHISRSLRGLQVEIDKHKITQVVRNFVTNALKFTPSKGRICITMSRTGQGEGGRKGLGGVRVEVQDSGAGISPENAKKLFGQYVQFDANKLQRGGSGLGLWISKAIVEMHGGSIGAHSEGEGKGCTFFFELPVKSIQERGFSKESRLNSLN